MTISAEYVQPVSTNRWMDRSAVRLHNVNRSSDVPLTGPAYPLVVTNALLRKAGTMSVITVDRLHKRYRDHVAVREVSFAVERGEIFGILGPNGAGKTTTVECIAGLRIADGGTIRVLGLDPRHDRDALRQQVGMQFRRVRCRRRSPSARRWSCITPSTMHRRTGSDLMETLGLRKCETCASGNSPAARSSASPSPLP